MSGKTMKQKVLIAGLGNPGDKYRRTRHNVGFLVLERLCEELGATGFTFERRFQGELATGRMESGVDVFLAKPDTFMNNSGACVQPLLKFHKIPFDMLLVIHDEIEQAFGKVDLRHGGGHRGHNGLRDIADKCGTKDFHRLRVGVGRPPPPSREVASYVLAPFSREEEAGLPSILDEGCRLAMDWLKNID